MAAGSKGKARPGRTERAPRRVQVGVRIPETSVEWLDAEAARRGLTRAGMVVLCVERVKAGTLGEPVTGEELRRRAGTAGRPNPSDRAAEQRR